VEGGGLGDVEVVAGEEAQGAAALEQVLQALVDELEAADHGEGDGDVDFVGQVEVGEQVW